MSLNILKLFSRNNISLTQKERDFLIEKKIIYLRNPTKEIYRDKTGDITLQEVGRFSDFSYWALSRIKQFFPHKVPQLRQILEGMDKKYYGSHHHLEVLFVLILFDEPVTSQEKKLVKESRDFRYPTKEEIEKYRERKYIFMGYNQ